MSAIVLAVALAAGQVKEPPAAVGMSESQAEQSAMLLAHCAGVWDWMGNIEKVAGKSSNVEQFHRKADEAETAAMWVLASQHYVATGNTASNRHWKSLTGPKREAGLAHLNALAEPGQEKASLAAIKGCQGMLQEQEKILHMMQKTKVKQ
ncbi:hypothetical protein XfCFBP8356_007455 [Xylella fastidiosa subsp. sandyi]|uniref:hypothetical protein n=1 Tax=Xylella fastidiosa TaxID=2371 RepID=UPI0007081E43|nr:hypothetical protein [Xylella fastidiosa]KQH74065.1 hypothetical protein AOT81_05340 [Xylella fastidiosa]RWA44481.1 hypothetical protein XfCFBP8356_05690 [Xylella fastidiosa subsp. sandyi]WNY18187.1 hypothetical protein RO839_06610 [Xylella fastidiosa]WNY20476.1 hypothetical protein RO838_06635 [Xylella fastidiosa]